MITGARRLPLHHVTIRVPWHDGGWTGSVCSRPLDNTSCLILPRIGEGRRDEVDARCASQRLDELDRADLPPCVGERVSFMAPFALTRTMTHPYTEFYPETHGHFASTRLVQPAYSAACVPFRWMLREKVEGNAKDGEVGMGAALLRWRPNQSLRRRRGRRQLDPSRRGEERRRVRWPTVLLSSATDGGLPLVLARFVRGLSTHQGSGCLRRLRTAATAAKCHRAPVDSHRVADQMPTGPSMSRRRAPHAASPLPRG